MKLIAGIAGGLILAILASMVASIMFAAGKSGPGVGAMTFLVAWAVGIAIALMAPRAGKAWRRLLISSALLSFMLPLSGLIYTGSFMATRTTGGAEAAGAAIGGGLVSGFLGFFGFFLGLVFLVIGLLVGRDREVVYVQAPAGSAPPRA